MPILLPLAVSTFFPISTKLIFRISCNLTRSSSSERSEENKKSQSAAIAKLEKISKNDKEAISKETSDKMESLQKSDYFNAPQTEVVAMMGYRPSFGQYMNVQLQDAQKWYIDKAIYQGNKIGYKANSSLFRGSEELMDRLISQQYTKER